MKDFTETVQTISLHGLGFIQLKLPNRTRIHIWHPDLPRRDCYEFSAIHNHRFSFQSVVLKGTQINKRYQLVPNPEGTHDIISHDGPRSLKGGRESFVCGRADMIPMPKEEYGVGQMYYMPLLAYHETPNSGVVITLMEKLKEGTIHACSTIEHGHEFHYDFDRFQWPEKRLWEYVRKAFES